MKLFIVFLVTLGVLTAPVAALAFAFSNPLGSPFGGRVTLTVPCTCSVPPTMLKIIVGPPKGGTFIYTPGVSTLYRFYKLLPPSWVLGTSVGRRECLIGVEPYCAPAGTGSLIRIMGTSL